MYYRELEWQVTEGSPRHLHVRSLDGKFSVRAKVTDEYTTAGLYGQASATYRRFWEGNPMAVITNIEVLGVEFPLGCEYAKAGFTVGGRGISLARYGIIHTELVRSCIEQWSHRRRFRHK
jgi:hypothetical protein